MITKIVFCIFAFISNCLLLHTVYNLVCFVSTQKLRAHDLDASTLTLITLNICLVLMFMAQHSALATSVYRDFMESLHLLPITRSMYTCLTALVIQFMMNKWQTIDEIQFWFIDTRDRPMLWFFFHILHWILWVLMFLQVLVSSPLQLTGVRQVWNFVKGVFPEETQFHRFLQHMAHPGAGCFVALLWIHPLMTFDRMILATILTAYLWTGFSVTAKDYAFMKSYSSYEFSSNEYSSTSSSTSLKRSLRPRH